MPWRPALRLSSNHQTSRCRNWWLRKSNWGVKRPVWGIAFGRGADPPPWSRRLCSWVAVAAAACGACYSSCVGRWSMWVVTGLVIRWPAVYCSRITVDHRALDARCDWSIHHFCFRRNLTSGLTNVAPAVFLRPTRWPLCIAAFCTLSIAVRPTTRPLV